MGFSTWPDALLDARGALLEALQPTPLPYREASALGVGLQLALGAALLCWVASVLTRNYSHTDRLWSVTPPVFAWHFAYRASLEDGGAWDARLVLMAALASLWGVRLTFNFWRKGGYSLSEEDYRWAVLRQHLHWTLYQVFNVVFIALYQHLLLFFIVLPSYVAYLQRHAAPLALAGLDGLAASLLLAALALETVADQQQWVFYQAKYALIAAKQPLTGDFQAGFNRSGLFQYSRHPNFFGEQAIWWAFYLFSVAASGEPLNPSVAGAVLLSLLFQGSTVFTEHITASKYPAYRAYQARVSALVPWFPSRAAASKTD